MAQQLIKVPPTKNTLLSLKRQVRFLEDGHALLERKRELLTRLVYQHINEYRVQRENAHQAIKQAYHWMGISFLRMGSRSLHQAGLGMKPSIEIDIIPKHSLGVEYPAINARELPMQPVGLLGTDASFDETRKQLTAAALQLARLGEAEMALGRLMAEQRKARKRVNALKYNIIPKYRKTIRYIESVLEEEERNMLFQIKLLRERDNAGIGFGSSSA
ncbi:MAG: V-type ATP synthase subunit D [Chromatiaceae bacterium]|nr:V-type ATP synthase subunit D [Gammaproteobacteria bacterium]MCB1873289.1 V-type ATP synthase subunit D [Gammaproteobacteria bacterium]MCB1881065.1 V-type ATP synthase subunit D [Gammaproteobacteria bacterium]MCP5448653.1 V-type ATP synthase subunit D [Chromatiaceae bacterium]